jgi:hypothetical protein
MQSTYDSEAGGAVRAGTAATATAPVWLSRTGGDRATGGAGSEATDATGTRTTGVPVLCSCRTDSGPLARGRKSSNPTGKRDVITDSASDVGSLHSGSARCDRESLVKSTLKES